MFAAALKGDEKTQNAQICDASFYAGEKSLIDHKTLEAELMIKQAGAACKGASLERAGALGEFRRMRH